MLTCGLIALPLAFIGRLEGLGIIPVALLLIATVGGFYTLRTLDADPIVVESRTMYIKKSEVGFWLIRGAGGDSYFRELAAIGGNTIRLA